MIFGECPYCGSTVISHLGPVGMVSKEDCGSCHEMYWLVHSRIDPVAYPKDYVIFDGVTKTVKINNKNSR